MSGSRKPLLLVDLLNWVHAHYYSARGSSSPSVTVVRKLVVLRDKYALERVIACGESPTGRTFRHDLVPDYKLKVAKELPEGVSEHVASAIELGRAEGIEYCHAINFEADDVIGSFASRHHGPVIIASSDGGLRQCLETGRVTILERIAESGEMEWFTADNLCSPDHDSHQPMARSGSPGPSGPPGWGISPAQCVDYLCLVGANRNGIHGAPGIGEKRATELLQQYGSFAGIVEAADTGKLTAGMAAGVKDLAPRIELVRQLVTVRRDALSAGHAWQCQLETLPGHVRALVCRCPACAGGTSVYSDVPGDENDRVIVWVKGIIAQRGWFDPMRDVAGASAV